MGTNAIDVFRHIPWNEVHVLVDELVDAGLDNPEGRAQVATMLDGLIPLAGVAEVLDGPIIRAALELAWAISQHNPGARKARIAARRAAHAAATQPA